MSFSAAEENFHLGARHGLDARLYWPGLGTVPVTELILRRLLPMAYEGLDAWGTDPVERDRLLGVIEQRCLLARNGATWQSECFHRVFEEGSGARFDALRAMVTRYSEHMHSNEPVHAWPL